jgi:two-component system sensor histidine kinase VanS
LNNDFSKFRRKILLQVLGIAIGGPLLWFLIQSLTIDGIFRSTFAEWFVQVYQDLFHTTYDDGVIFYHRVFRVNRSQWLSAGLVVLLLLIFYLVMMRMTGYFKEVIAGIDQLVKESNGVIILSPELDSIAAKLNQIKHNLEKRQKDALEAEQRKNDLVVYLAHDIKTPLTSVIGYLSLLDEAANMPVEQKAEYIGITLEKAYRLEQLINEFFEITRFNLQSIELYKDRIDLTFMLRQIADEFYPMLVSSGKQIFVDSQDDIYLSGDAEKLARVFNNILKNAVVYSYPGSIIKIHAEQQGENVVITFANNGDPIPSHQLDQIFEKFYRLDPSRSADTAGSGLGLAIAREIIQAHGGRISVQSSERETAFTVTLPISGVEFPPIEQPILRKS